MYESDLSCYEREVLSSLLKDKVILVQGSKAWDVLSCTYKHSEPQDQVEVNFHFHVRAALPTIYID